jgi:hypothetical protein
MADEGATATAPSLDGDHVGGSSGLRRPGLSLRRSSTGPALHHTLSNSSLRTTRSRQERVRERRIAPLDKTPY